jgi:predicted amidophosphoribosyltransferase
MFAVFLIVRIAAKARAKQPVTTRACPYCQQSISKLATKCPYCCSTVKPEEIGAVEDTDLAKGIKSLTEKVGKVARVAKKVTKIKK